jgi:hypothetical protein
MAVIRYVWMFRTAAVVYLSLGLAAAWRFGLTDYDPAHRVTGVGIGVLTAITGIFLFRRAKWAIGLSAIGAGVISVAAAVALPILSGPAILVFIPVAVVFGLYAALAGRVLFERAA